jgi:hypothetical protein
MSLAKLILSHCREHMGLVHAVEGASIDLQVLLASCDGTMATEERNVLAINAQFFQDPERVEKRLDERLRELDEVGFEAASHRVLGNLVQLFNDLPNNVRTEVAHEMLRAGLRIITADKEVSSAERSFVTQSVVPALGLELNDAEELLAQGEEEIARERSYAEFAFVLFVLLCDADKENQPPRDSPRETIPTGFLGGVRTLVSVFDLGSENAIGYFLSAIGGLGVANSYPEHCKRLQQIAIETRASVESNGVAHVLSEIREKIDDIVNEGTDFFALDTVANHLTTVFGSLENVSPGQRACFSEVIAPALDLNVEELIEQSKAVSEVNPMLYNNLTGEHRIASE